MLDKIIPALIGATAGLLSFLFIGWTEGQKQFEIQKANAYVSFIRDSWVDNADKAGTAYLKAVSALTIYSSREVLAAHALYVAENCAGRADPPPCRLRWAELVNAMRESLGERHASEQSIIAALWGTAADAGL